MGLAQREIRAPVSIPELSTELQSFSPLSLQFLWLCITLDTDLSASSSVGSMSSPGAQFQRELLLVESEAGNVRGRWIETGRSQEERGLGTLPQRMGEIPPTKWEGNKVGYHWDQAEFLFSLLQQHRIPTWPWSLKAGQRFSQTWASHVSPLKFPGPAGEC